MNQQNPSVTSVRWLSSHRGKRPAFHPPVPPRTAALGFGSHLFKRFREAICYIRPICMNGLLQNQMCLISRQSTSITKGRCIMHVSYLSRPSVLLSLSSLLWLPLFFLCCLSFFIFPMFWYFYLSWPPRVPSPYYIVAFNWLHSVFEFVGG